MKEILSFINNNGIAAVITTLGTAIATLVVQWIIKRSDRKYNERQEKEKLKREEYINKGELHIEGTGFDNDNTVIQKINLLIACFNVKVSKNKEIIDFYYNKDILKPKKYQHLSFYLKNIGNCDINQLDICINNQKRHMLCYPECINQIVNNKWVNYSICYDKKILKGETILIDIAYLLDDEILNTFSSELVLLFKDSYGNLYEQPFFIQEGNLYEPSHISSQQYKLYTSPKTALQCFKEPWLW